MCFLLGGRKPGGRKACQGKYSDFANVDRAIQRLAAYWEREILKASGIYAQRSYEYHAEHLESLSGGGQYHVFQVCILHRGGGEEQGWVTGTLRRMP